MVHYLYNSSGKWIAFRIGRFLYNAKAKWIGWFPWNNDIAVNTKGRYIGTIYYKNRLYFDRTQGFLPYPGYPGYPGHPGYPGYPGSAGYVGLLPGTKDVDENSLE